MYATPRLFRRMAAAGPAGPCGAPRDSDTAAQSHNKIRRRVRFIFNAWALSGLRFLDGDDSAGFDVCHPIHLAAGPSDLDGIGLRPAAKPESQHPFALRKIARTAAQHLRLRFSAGGNSNECAE